MNEEIIEIDPLTDSNEFKRQLSEQQRETLRELRAVREMLLARDQQITKRLHNIFSWIASQFKT